MPKYTVEVVEKAEAPEGAKAKRWYRYVISNGVNIITGCRMGTEREVRNFANDCTRQLNQKYSTSAKQKHFQPAFSTQPFEMSA